MSAEPQVNRPCGLDVRAKHVKTVRRVVSEILAASAQDADVTALLRTIAREARQATASHLWQHNIFGCSSLFVHAYGSVDVTHSGAAQPRRPGDFAVTVDAPFRFFAVDMLRGLQLAGLVPTKTPKFETVFPFGYSEGFARVLVSFDLDEIRSCVEKHRRSAPHVS